MGGSSITSNKPLMVSTGTDPEYSVEDYLNAVTSNLVLNIGPEPINTPLDQNWIQRRTAFSFTYRNKIRLEKIHARILQNVDFGELIMKN